MDHEEIPGEAVTIQHESFENQRAIRHHGAYYLVDIIKTADGPTLRIMPLGRKDITHIDHPQNPELSKDERAAIGILEKRRLATSRGESYQPENVNLECSVMISDNYL